MKKNDIRKLVLRIFEGTIYTCSEYHLNQILQESINRNFEITQVEKILLIIKKHLSFFDEELKSYDRNIYFYFQTYCDAVYDKKDRAYMDCEKLIKEVSEKRKIIRKLERINIPAVIEHKKAYVAIVDNLNDISLLEKREKRFWALEDEEVDALIQFKMQKIKITQTNFKEITKHYNCEDLYDLEINQVIENEQELNNPKGLEEEDQDENTKSEKLELDLDNEHNSMNKYDNFTAPKREDIYSGLEKNPWNDVFGDTDEARSAYWSTD